MLTLGNPRHRLSRRGLLCAGSLGLGGLALPDLLRAEAVQGSPSRKKSVVYLVLGGGPSHIDMWDLKPDAPWEIRGPFAPIATRQPGVSICEHMPQQAALFDQFSLVRGVRSVENDHYLSEVYTGLPRTAGQRPAFGSAVSRLSLPDTPLPPYVSLNEPTTEVFEFERPHYAGRVHAPFRPFGEALSDMKPALDAARLGDRRALLSQFSDLARRVDRLDDRSGLDGFTRRALDILTSPKVRDAFDLSQESPETFERYGKGKWAFAGVGNTPIYDWDNKLFVLARRLVEAGVRVVTLRVGAWDHHGNLPGSIFACIQTMMPLLDASMAAMVTDLRERGLFDDVLFVVLGEFGRTPRITPTGPGREHWADAGCVLFAGGGLKMGQTIGATDRHAALSTTGHISMQHVMATIYRVLGIDPAAQIHDFNGRPQYLLDDHEPIQELDPPVA